MFLPRPSDPNAVPSAWLQRWLQPDRESGRPPPEPPTALDNALGLRTVSRMVHSPQFLKLVDDARARVKEVTLDEAKALLSRHPPAVLLDVREDLEWQAGHAAQAVHLGKGILERDLETRFPDPDTEIVMYCGGGYRSALTADAAQKMGYRHVYSLIGGYKGLVAAQWPMVRPESA